MIITSEIPISGIKAGIRGQFWFLIETYMKKPGYIPKDCTLSGYSIIDNGYFEMVALGLKAKNVLPARRGQAFRVIPEKGNATHLVHRFIQDKTIFISHAATEDQAVAEYLMFAAEARKRAYQVMFGITYDCEWFSKNPFIRAFQRYHLIRRLSKLEGARAIPIHLMGCNSLFELWLCKRQFMVRSCDTSLPITAAIAGKKVGWFKKYPQFKKFIDYKMTPEQIELGKKNMAKCIKVLN